MAGKSRREEAESYPAIVARLNADWRVIECRDGIQWKRHVGKRHGQTRWDGRCYCLTRNGLMARVRELAGEIDTIGMARLENLPGSIGIGFNPKSSSAAIREADLVRAKAP